MKMRPYIFLKLSEISSGISKLSLAMFKSIQKLNHWPIVVFMNYWNIKFWPNSGQNGCPEVKMTPYIVFKLSEISSRISKLSLAMFKSIQKPNYRPLIVFILLKYQILAKLRPKWVSGGENDSLSVLKLTELSSGIFKLPCKTLWFLQKPKNQLCTTSSSRDMEFLDFGSVSDDPRPSRGRKWANVCIFSWSPTYSKKYMPWGCQNA